MKRNIGILLVIILLLSWCNNKTTNNDSNKNNNDKNKAYLKDDTYYMYETGNIKKELLLRKDGTLFLGNPSTGSLNFNGSKGIIESSSYVGKQHGIKIDLKEGY